MQRSVIRAVSLSWIMACAAGAQADVVIAKAKPGIVPSLPESPLLVASGVREIRPTIDFPLANPQLASAIGLDRYYTIELAEGIDAVAGIAALTRMTDMFEVVEEPQIGTTAGVVPADPLFARQWSLRNIGQGIGCEPPNQLQMLVSSSAGLPDIGATAAWEIASQAEQLVIAVLDSGVNQHPDLRELVPGWAMDNGTVGDQCNHGTHVSGIIGASANNNVGIAGVAWNARILPVRVLNGCFGNDLHYGQGLIWAADRAQIANSSLQYYNVGTFMADAVAYAAGQGMIMVAASGNWQNVVAFPARFPQVIAVGATRINDTRAVFSNSGPEVEISAPGDSVLSLDAGFAQAGNTGYMCLSGTSMASPHVAGAVALIKSIQPNATSAQVRRILASSVKDLGAPGRDPQFGWGRLNLNHALRLAACYADADFNGTLDGQDLTIFKTRLSQEHPYADLNDDGLWDAADHFLYMELYTRGCH